jgi:hypothetical protein
MFELGMRLAFDKPTVIVKDDVTAYSFDTAPIEHVVYPRDLRYTAIKEFKGTLAVKVKATHDKATSDGSYSPFLKHFGGLVLPKKGAIRRLDFFSPNNSSSSALVVRTA